MQTKSKTFKFKIFVFHLYKNLPYKGQEAVKKSASTDLISANNPECSVCKSREEAHFSYLVFRVCCSL